MLQEKLLVWQFNRGNRDVSNEHGKVLVRSAKLSPDGKIVEAVCITGKGGTTIRTNPRWTHFDGDWWQTDD